LQGKTLKLHASPDDESDIPDEALVKFYESLGFKAGKRPTSPMVRKPVAPSILDAASPDDLKAAFRIRGPNGEERIFTGGNHGTAYDNAVAEFGDAYVGRASSDMWGGKQPPAFAQDPVMGFIDREGRYLTREEAANALETRQPMTAEELEELQAER